MRVISGKARGTKLNSIDSLGTRPTLDRVKESLFNIIQNDIKDSYVLDLFSGSGAMAIEFLSRGAKKAYLCENNHNAIKIIYQNLEKTNLKENAVVIENDYKKVLEKLKKINIKFDYIYIDPPFQKNIATMAIEKLLENELLKEDGIVILETDEKERDLLELENIDIEVYDIRKYGRINLIFLKKK